MPTKRTRITRRMEGDVEDWLTLLFEEQLVYKYFGPRGDEPFIDFCFLIFGPDPGKETNGLRELWEQHRAKILQARDELAPDLELWAEKEFDEAGE